MFEERYTCFDRRIPNTKIGIYNLSGQHYKTIENIRPYRFGAYRILHNNDYLFIINCAAMCDRHIIKIFSKKTFSYIKEYIVQTSRIMGIYNNIIYGYTKYQTDISGLFKLKYISTFDALTGKFLYKIPFKKKSYIWSYNIQIYDNKLFYNSGKNIKMYSLIN